MVMIMMMIIIIILITGIAIVTIIVVAVAVDSIWWQTSLTCYCLHPDAVPRRGRDARQICRLTVTSCGSGVVADSVQTFPVTGNRPLTACVMELCNPFKTETWIADRPKITRQTTISLWQLLLAQKLVPPFICAAEGTVHYPAARSLCTACSSGISNILL